MKCITKYRYQSWDHEIKNLKAKEMSIEVCVC